MRKIILVSMLSVTTLLAGCGSLGVTEIPSSEVPEGLWDGDGSIHVSSFRIDDPTLRKVRKAGDCPGQTIAYGDRRAFCAETRVKDTEQNCNLVFSTYGEGYCPPTYDYQSAVNNQTMQRTDAVMSAGTAAQNAILAWGEKLALDAQIKSKKLIAEHILTSTLGSANHEQNYIKTSETVIESTKGIKPLELIARTRAGFYSDCLMPKFTYSCVYMNSSYYRIEPNKIACKLEPDGNYLPSYYNMRTNNKQKTSMVGFLALKQKDSLFDICMRDSIMGVCVFTKEGVRESTDFELIRGFVENPEHRNTFFSLEAISNEKITISIQQHSENGEISATSHVVPIDGEHHEVKGLSIAVIEPIEAGAVTLSVHGKIKD